MKYEIQFQGCGNVSEKKGIVEMGLIRQWHVEILNVIRQAMVKIGNGK